MAELTTPEKEDLFKEFIVEKKVLIADSSAGVRSGITKVLRELGAKTANIVLCQNFASAVEELEKIQPQVVICDYLLGDACGLKLLQAQRKELMNPQDSLFVLVTANASESAVAEAAEEEVDSYVLKPFTLAVFREQIVKAAISKIRPSGYQQLVLEGKEHLKVRELDEAKALFEKAVSQNSKPTLAYYYLGVTNALQMMAENAEKSYRSGLAINDRHYRCLTGLCDLLLQTQRHQDAYDVAKVIAATFPLSPQRLETILRLAVRNQTFDDVGYLYDIYVSIEFRTPELIKCMKAALVVSGSYYLKRYRIERAVECFRKAAITANRQPMVLSEIIAALLKHGYPEEADQFLKEFPAESRTAPIFVISELKIMNARGSGGVIERARELIRKGIHDAGVYEILIVRSIEAKFNDSAEALAYDAANRWPEKKQDFLRLIGVGPAAQTE